MCLPKLHYSYRRELLDKELNALSPQISGRALDLGGKKVNKRGEFTPPQTADWTYLNINPAEGADVIADGEAIPAKSASFDWVFSIEVIEFVKNPEKFISEISRVLKQGGKFVLTSPFLYRIHGKPKDLQRFTDEKLKQLLAPAFEIKILKPQGYFFTVLADLEKSFVAHIKFAPLRYFKTILLIPSLALLRFADQLKSVAKSDFLSSFTTGYFILAEKK